MKEIAADDAQFQASPSLLPRQTGLRRRNKRKRSEGSERQVLRDNAEEVGWNLHNSMFVTVVSLLFDAILFSANGW